MVSIETAPNPARRSRRVPRVVFAAALALSIPAFVSACAPPTTNDSTASSSTAAPSGSGSGSGSASATLSEKVIRVGWKSDIDTLNPLTTTTTEAIEVQSLIYDTLLAYGTDLKQEPGLASTVKREGNTITYTLREGVTWHDGTAFSAEDVVYTFDLIGKNQLGINAQYFTDFVSAKALSPTEVQVTFKKPQAFDPGLVVPILPKHIWSKMSVDQMKKFPNENPIGTGPYTFKERKQGQVVAVSRNPKWWGTLPAAGGISWTVFTNDDIEAQALKNGEIDIIPQVPPTVFDGMQGDNTITTQELPSFSFHHIGMNVSADPKSKGNPLLKDVAVRQALGYALDREQIVQLAYAGHASAGGSILPPAFGDYYWEPGATEAINNNLDKANALLDQAGYTTKDGDGIRQTKDGKPLEFRLIAIDSTTTDVRTAQLFQETAKKAGIKLDFSTVDSDTMDSTVYNTEAPDWDMFVWGWDSGTNDPSYLLGVPLTSQIGGNNDVFYSNKKYDDLYAQQATELDPAKRQALVKQMQQMFYSDSAYLVAVYLKKLQAYRNDTWTGWVPADGGIIFNFTRDNYLKAVPAA